MRIRAFATLLLAVFVAIALGTIVMRSSAPARPPTPETAIAAVAGPARDAPTAELQTTTAIAGTSPQAVVPSRSADVMESKAPATASRVEVTARPAKPETALALRRNEPEHVRKVVATYFHGNVRCTTCRKVEAYAKDAVEQGFQSQVAAGTVEFRAVNIEEAANAHFIQDFQLTNKSVVVTDELDGKVVRWAKLDEVWSLVGKPEAYHQYVQDAVRGYLEVR